MRFNDGSIVSHTWPPKIATSWMGLRRIVRGETYSLFWMLSFHLIKRWALNSYDFNTTHKWLRWQCVIEHSHHSILWLASPQAISGGCSGVGVGCTASCFISRVFVCACGKPQPSTTFSCLFLSPFFSTQNKRAPFLGPFEHLYGLAKPYTHAPVRRVPKVQILWILWFQPAPAKVLVSEAPKARAATPEAERLAEVAVAEAVNMIEILYKLKNVAPWLAAMRVMLSGLKLLVNSFLKKFLQRCFCSGCVHPIAAVNFPQLYMCFIIKNVTVVAFTSCSVFIIVAHKKLPPTVSIDFT